MSQTERRWSGAVSDGAEWEIVVPPNWNGRLVLEADLWRNERDECLYAWLARGGSARARLSRTGHEWDFPRTADHLERLLGEVRRTIGVPESVIMWGRSLGSFVARLSAESGVVPVTGAIVVDGGGMGARGPMEAGADARFVLAVLASADDEERAALGRSPEAARALLERWRSDPRGRARLTLAAAMRGTPVSSADAQTPAEEQTNDVIDGLLIDLVMGLESRNTSYRHAGGDYTDNTVYDYCRAYEDSPSRDLVALSYRKAGLDLTAELGTLASAPRHAGVPDAVAWIARYGTVTGDIRVPVLAVKGMHDPASVPAEESGYAELVRRRGKTEQYRHLNTDAPGHVGQSALELAVAFDLLLERIGTGQWPATEAASLLARAEQVSTARDGDLLLGPDETVASVFSYLDASIPLHPRYLQEVAA